MWYRIREGHSEMAVRPSPKGKTAKCHHNGSNQRYAKLPERDRRGPRTAGLDTEPNRK